MRFPDFQTIVRLSALGIGRLYAKEVFLVIIFNIS